MVERDHESLAKHVAAALREGGIAAMESVPGYLCDHPTAREMALTAPFGVVGCAAMRMYAAPCEPSGNLFSPKEQDAG